MRARKEVGVRLNTHPLDLIVHQNLLEHHSRPGVVRANSLRNLPAEGMGLEPMANEMQLAMCICEWSSDAPLARYAARTGLVMLPGSLKRGKG
jgi:hypothetical protein